MINKPWSDAAHIKRPITLTDRAAQYTKFTSHASHAKEPKDKTNHNDHKRPVAGGGLEISYAFLHSHRPPSLSHKTKPTASSSPYSRTHLYWPRSLSLGFERDRENGVEVQLRRRLRVQVLAHSGGDVRPHCDAGRLYYPHALY